MCENFVAGTLGLGPSMSERANELSPISVTDICKEVEQSHVHILVLETVAMALSTARAHSRCRGVQDGVSIPLETLKPGPSLSRNVLQIGVREFEESPHTTSNLSGFLRTMLPFPGDKAGGPLGHVP